MTEPRKPHLPIGYWLKKADESITRCVNQSQEAYGLSRTDWQVLNTLYEIDSASWAELSEPMRPFVDRTRLESLVGDLVQRGLVQGGGSLEDPLCLTESGRELHRAALEAQKRVRQEAVKGITEADYATTIRVLQRIVANLDSEAAQQVAPPDRASRGG